MRLNTALVSLGFAKSRRAANDLIADNKVLVNEAIVTDFSFDVLSGDNVQVGNKSRKYTDQQQQIVLFNKPKGYVSSHQAQKGQHSLFELLPDEYKTLRMSGRLDQDSEGLVILSNDGTWLQQFSHPSNGHKKVYRVTVNEKLSPQVLKQLSQPLMLDGHSVVALAVKQISQHELEIAIAQGLNRQIRRMCGAIGLSVKKLVRIQIGPYGLDGLRTGQWLVLK